MAHQCFDFSTVRARQRRCSLPILRSVVCPDELNELESLVKDGHVKKVLPVLKAKIGSNDSPSEVKFMALLLRAEMQVKRTKHAEAKADLESAIFENPNVVEAYLKLFDVEVELGHFGKAEVVASLGLRLDPDNPNLKAKLNRLRDADSVHPSLPCREGSTVDLLMKRAGRDFQKLPLPPIILAIFESDLERVRVLWRPSFLSFRYTVLQSSLIHVAVITANLALPIEEDGRRCSTQYLANLIKRFRDIIDFLFEKGCRLDCRDLSGFTAINHASQLGCVSPKLDILEHLLKKGADPNLQSCFGCYPLLNAIECNNIKAAELLLRYGANPSLLHNGGKTAFSAAKDRPKMMDLIQKYAPS